MRIKVQWSLVFFALFGAHECLAGGREVILETGGTQIVLSNGREQLDQPENFFVQKRAINGEQRVALSAGAFVLDLTLEQYVALGICGFELGPKKSLEKTTKRVSELTHIPAKEIEKAVQSHLGQQTLGQIKKASSSCSFEFLSVTNIEIAGVSAFEIHSKTTILQSKQTVFSRQILYQGKEPQQIVQITYASPSNEIFQDKSLIESIKKQK